MEGGVSADGHVSSTEIIINGPHQTHDVQMTVMFGCFFSDPACERQPDVMRISPKIIQYMRADVMFIKHGWKMFKWQANQSDFLPFFSSSSSSPVHSVRKILAPVRLPSPPQTHRLEMPRFTRLNAADKRPSRVVKALQRALPITVPPWTKHTQTKIHQTFHMNHVQKSVLMLNVLLQKCIAVLRSNAPFMHEAHIKQPGVHQSIRTFKCKTDPTNSLTEIHQKVCRYLVSSCYFSHETHANDFISGFLMQLSFVKQWQRLSNKVWIFSQTSSYLFH